MEAKVYFCTESDSIGTILRAQIISRQALDTIYELVWQCEFKNILNAGRIWLKFREEERPFGIPPRQKRSHRKISPGDIIQIDNVFYMVGQVGARQIELAD
jgi:DNA helicase TIP49 (TBP-interacting protein)